MSTHVSSVQHCLSHRVQAAHTSRHRVTPKYLRDHKYAHAHAHACTHTCSMYTHIHTHTHYRAFMYLSIMGLSSAKPTTKERPEGHRITQSHGAQSPGFQIFPPEGRWPLRSETCTCERIVPSAGPRREATVLWLPTMHHQAWARTWLLLMYILVRTFPLSFLALQSHPLPNLNPTQVPTPSPAGEGCWRSMPRLAWLFL